jgi:hypothetical protein
MAFLLSSHVAAPSSAPAPRRFAGNSPSRAPPPRRISMVRIGPKLVLCVEKTLPCTALALCRTDAALPVFLSSLCTHSMPLNLSYRLNSCAIYPAASRTLYPFRHLSIFGMQSSIRDGSPPVNRCTCNSAQARAQSADEYSFLVLSLFLAEVDMRAFTSRLHTVNSCAHVCRSFRLRHHIFLLEACTASVRHARVVFSAGVLCDLWLWARL